MKHSWPSYFVDLWGLTTKGTSLMPVFSCLSASHMLQACYKQGSFAFKPGEWDIGRVDRPRHDRHHS
jgi:hypothetical protein